ALLRRPLVPAAGRRALHAAARDVGRARGPLRRGRRERPAVGDAVPPREVRRRRRPAAAQLGPEPEGTLIHRMERLELLPAVDVADGQAVRLVQGEAGSETSYGDPLQAALDWQAGGAEWIHLVDL